MLHTLVVLCEEHPMVTVVVPHKGPNVEIWCFLSSFSLTMMSVKFQDSLTPMWHHCHEYNIALQLVESLGRHWQVISRNYHNSNSRHFYNICYFLVIHVKKYFAWHLPQSAIQIPPQGTFMYHRGPTDVEDDRPPHPMMARAVSASGLYGLIVTFHAVKCWLYACELTN